QLLCDVVDLLGDDLFGDERAFPSICDHALCPVGDGGDLDRVAVPVIQLRRFVGIARLNRSERQALLNDWPPTRARIYLLNQLLASNAAGWDLNSSAINDCHVCILLLADGGAY